MVEHINDYGFFCDLENSNIMEYDEVEYYVVTKRTHYEVRKKLTSRPVIHGNPHSKLDLASTKSSLDDIEKNTRALTPEQRNDGSKCNIISYMRRLPRDIYYSFIVCFTTVSCIYLVVNQPEYKK
jgi:hypothetical protein